MASNDGLYGMKNHTDAQHLNSKLLPGSTNTTNNVSNPPSTSNYQWSQSANDVVYPNNNPVSNNAPAPYTFNDG